jgi:DNA-binding response OmpR family regulator
MKDTESHIYRFDEVEIDPRNLRLTVGSEIRAMEPKSFRLLLYLVENPGRDPQRSLAGCRRFR